MFIHISRIFNTLSTILQILAKIANDYISFCKTFYVRCLKDSEYASVSNFSRLSLTFCFQHIQSFFTHVYIYSGLLRHIQNPGTLRHIYLYLEPRRIQAYSKLKTNFQEFKHIQNSARLLRLRSLQKYRPQTNFTSSIFKCLSKSWMCLRTDGCFLHDILFVNDCVVKLKKI